MNVDTISNNDQFDEEVIRSSRPTAAVFFANWCPYCRRFLPTFIDLAARFGSKIDFARIDIDETPELEDRWSVGKVPTVILFEEGSETQRWVNEQDRAAYEGSLQQAAKRTRP